MLVLTLSYTSGAEITSTEIPETLTVKNVSAGKTLGTFEFEKLVPEGLHKLFTYGATRYGRDGVPSEAHVRVNKAAGLYGEQIIRERGASVPLSVSTFKTSVIHLGRAKVLTVEQIGKLGSTLDAIYSNAVALGISKTSLKQHRAIAESLDALSA